MLGVRMLERRPRLDVETPLVVLYGRAAPAHQAAQPGLVEVRRNPWREIARRRVVIPQEQAVDAFDARYGLFDLPVPRPCIPPTGRVRKPRPVRHLHHRPHEPGDDVVWMFSLPQEGREDSRAGRVDVRGHLGELTRDIYRLV
jgi:hypothetical protein